MRFFQMLMAIAAVVFVSTDATAQSTSKTALLNPNVATEQELMALPNLNATIVKSILARRPYKTMLDVNAHLSPMLTKEQLTGLYARLFLPLDLNTATREEILLVPGVGPRLAHEFEEYRPYKAIAQFRKEIGKYVSKEEVARLEQYVTIR